MVRLSMSTRRLVVRLVKTMLVVLLYERGFYLFVISPVLYDIPHIAIAYKKKLLWSHVYCIRDQNQFIRLLKY
jgi:hypothetical protein